MPTSVPLNIKPSLDALNAESPDSTVEFVAKHIALIGAFIQATKSLIDKTSSLEKEASIKKFNENFLREILPLLDEYGVKPFKKLVERCISNPSNALEIGIRDILNELYKLGAIVCTVTFNSRAPEPNSGWKTVECIADAFLSTLAIEFHNKDLEKEIDAKFYPHQLPVDSNLPRGTLTSDQFLQAICYRIQSCLNKPYPRAFVQFLLLNIDEIVPSMIIDHFKKCLESTGNKEFTLRLKTHKQLISLVLGRELFGKGSEFSCKFNDAHTALIEKDKKLRGKQSYLLGQPVNCLLTLFDIYTKTYIANLTKDVPIHDTSCAEFFEKIYNSDPRLLDKNIFAENMVPILMEINNFALRTFAIKIAIENKIKGAEHFCGQYFTWIKEHKHALSLDQIQQAQSFLNELKLTKESLYRNKLEELKTILQETLKSLSEVVPTPAPVIDPTKQTSTLVVSAATNPPANSIARLLQGIIESSSPGAIETPSPAGINQNIDEHSRNEPPRNVK